ncbi:uncharacterized protein LOC110450956 [Mizuhopecten yessoensis]|uniref:uncharacterized protein LOC110450956 n=1 Tax=Mizuhopecten yessoensis TaxID=6573 RepID=UPI000B45D216|nr:uncharacterized protein LOC110450956 [Mizuhopecten yessoensis]
MKSLTVLLVLCCMFSGWTNADDMNTHTQLLQRILSALEREVEKLEDQHVDREIEDDDTLNDPLERLAQIMTLGSNRKGTNPKIVNKKSDQSISEVNAETRDSEMTEEKKNTVKRLLVSLMKKTKHCGPLGVGEICADSHDCCCGYTCWKWRCQDKPKVNSNWWDDLHLS